MALTKTEIADTRLVVAGRVADPTTVEVTDTERDGLRYLLAALGVLGVKICQTCREEKELHEFHRKPGTADGRDSTCRDCKNLADRRAYEAKKRKRR